MPKRITPLSEVKVRNAKSRGNAYKLFDGGGLFLFLTPTGGKLWHFKYRFDNREKKLALGTYPEISLTDPKEVAPLLRAIDGYPTLQRIQGKKLEQQNLWYQRMGRIQSSLSQ